MLYGGFASNVGLAQCRRHLACPQIGTQLCLPLRELATRQTHGAPTAPGPGSANVLIGGQPAWRSLIDQHACPAVSVSGADGVGSVVKGSATVLINNQMSCRVADIIVEKPGLAMGPANPIAMGCPTVMIGEMGRPPLRL
jgi:uncharacterized Zn-binding protein involved in type VI secretion